MAKRLEDNVKAGFFKRHWCETALAGIVAGFAILSIALVEPKTRSYSPPTAVERVERVITFEEAYADPSLRPPHLEQIADSLGRDKKLSPIIYDGDKKIVIAKITSRGKHSIINEDGLLRLQVDPWTPEEISALQAGGPMQVVFDHKSFGRNPCPIYVSDSAYQAVKEGASASSYRDVRIRSAVLHELRHSELLSTGRLPWNRGKITYDQMLLLDFLGMFIPLTEVDAYGEQVKFQFQQGLLLHGSSDIARFDAENYRTNYDTLVDLTTRNSSLLQANGLLKPIQDLIETSSGHQATGAILRRDYKEAVR